MLEGNTNRILWGLLGLIILVMFVGLISWVMTGHGWGDHSKDSDDNRPDNWMQKYENTKRNKQTMTILSRVDLPDMKYSK